MCVGELGGSRPRRHEVLQDQFLPGALHDGGRHEVLQDRFLPVALHDAPRHEAARVPP